MIFGTLSILWPVLALVGLRTARAVSDWKQANRTRDLRLADYCLPTHRLSETSAAL